MSSRAIPVVDMHVHVGVVGKPGSESGFISTKMVQSLTFKIFLLYARVPPAEASDQRLFDEAIKVFRESKVDRIICLALDAVHDKDGVRRFDATAMYVPNEFILKLRRALPQKILFGASVHPYDPAFKERVSQAVADGAVLLKWLPSAQQINLADDRVRRALEFLATARAGAPLPLLLHVGSEGAIISTDSRTMSYDFLSWNAGDWIGARLPGRNWHTPDMKGVHANLRAGFAAGACIIFAHCGLPYFVPTLLRPWEHSDLDAVAGYLRQYPGRNGTISGKAFADVSAFGTPVRQTFFNRIRQLPAESLLFGSDFPVPIFELSADLEENIRDFKAILRGDFSRIVIPQDNLLNVNLRELEKAFPGHPMFTNSRQLPGWTGE